MVNVVGFKTVPQSKGLPLNGEVSLLCSVIGDGLTQLAWVRADSSKWELILPYFIHLHPVTRRRKIPVSIDDQYHKKTVIRIQCIAVSLLFYKHATRANMYPFRRDTEQQYGKFQYRLLDQQCPDDGREGCLLLQSCFRRRLHY